MNKRLVLAVLCLAIAASSYATPLDDAIKAIDAGRDAQAFQLLTPLANEGNAQAQYRLGILYYHGKGAPEDENLAIYWWKKAAAQGNSEAMFHIANAYLFNPKAEKMVSDPDREAAIWFFQAASAGHAEAQYYLGLLFLAGKGVVENRREAIRWFRKAADQGHAEARKAIESAEKSSLPPRR
ncbi:MAG TPA: tetratricopeptide repeat protein [Rhodocyclaceae bacterium]|nr:tetratricopeptide repeat protein [Rhodocyclaceae bacterium]